jgi:uncharacterized protein (DUF2164 family)
MKRSATTITFPNDGRKHAIASLQQYFAENMDEEIGELKAGLLVDFVAAELGPTIYNQAIADARTFFEERSADLAGVCYHAEFPLSVKRKR